MRRLGKAIAKRRRALKLTQEDVSHSADLTTKYYSDCENGKRRMSLVVADRIASALGWRLQRLLDAADKLTKL